MARPIRATISLPALRRNYATAKRTASRAKVLAVVKANGYGHGVERVARALTDADGFALVEIEAAVAMRSRGIAQPILLLEGFFEPGELAIIAANGLATVVHHGDQLRVLETNRPAKPVDVFLKINTGMNRLGFAPDDARRALARLQKTGAAKSLTLLTHFATADGPP